ncbi:MAG: phosphoribosylformylglycinamidine synthase I [Candidatus Margulisbacteria bacterium GWF2_35_9]|nr:MAG: phosphoribosylformylglycinamidine synthase I [Candidatus Margulisbacteria bacterium GWF2_35_9]
MKYGVIVFPGSNCDTDCFYAIKNELNEKVEYIWHAETSLPKDLDVIIVPGGFSYGDYLRAGAIAKFAKIMPEIIKFAGKGGYVIGVCNGFQILTEVGLLPGALLHNDSQKFICKEVNLKVISTASKFTSNYKKDTLLTIPIAHGEGRYYIDANGLESLKDNDQIAFQYVDKKGIVSKESNPNGSLNNIAGVFNKKKNVLGMMPHPERCNYSHKDSLKLFSIN